MQKENVQTTWRTRHRSASVPKYSTTASLEFDHFIGILMKCHNVPNKNSLVVIEFTLTRKTQCLWERSKHSRLHKCTLCSLWIRTALVDEIVYPPLVHSLFAQLIIVHCFNPWSIGICTHTKPQTFVEHEYWCYLTNSTGSIQHKLLGQLYVLSLRCLACSPQQRSGVKNVY